LLGRETRHAAGTQQYLQQLSEANNTNALTCMFLATQLYSTNAEILSFASE
jgi:hypothetical protein